MVRVSPGWTASWHLEGKTLTLPSPLEGEGGAPSPWSSPWEGEGMRVLRPGAPGPPPARPQGARRRRSLTMVTVAGARKTPTVMRERASQSTFMPKLL